MKCVPSLLAVLLLALVYQNTVADEPKVHMANGIKIGEVDQDSAIVWTRLTRHPERNIEGTPFNESDGIDGAGLENLEAREGSVPGADGELRVTFWPKSSPDRRRSTDWQAVDTRKDFTRQFQLQDLAAGKQYSVLVEGRESPSDKTYCKLDGGFRTAPMPDNSSPVSLMVVACQDWPRRDDRANGHKIYNSMKKLNPDFFVHTGDIEYYDTPRPYATTVPSARFKWNRLYSMPFQREFHRYVASYFIKDDHDTLKNDCWPGQRFGDLTFEQGLALFREQVPMGEKTYRTVRWGKDLQIWLVEGRDYRSPNDMEDGRDKTIWGEPQKKWFFDTVSKSDATFRLLISPTPIVGPDRGWKDDNHANPGFDYEGNQLRKFISTQQDMFVVCGDRHWQYVSVDPETGIREFGCGPSSDSHASGFTKGQETTMHHFLRNDGGFLHINVERKDDVPQMTFRHCGVDSTIYHNETQTAKR